MNEVEVSRKMNGTKYYSCLSDEEKNETWDFFLKCNKVK